jgi:hypothetical protein
MLDAHGADIISINQKTGAVTLWDAKYRSNSVKYILTGYPIL